MKTEAARIASGIRELANEALRRLSAGSPALKLAHRRVSCPVDYMRYAEFAALARLLNVHPGARILDVAGPEWFCLYLAKTRPDATFTYVNLSAGLVSKMESIRMACGIDNLRYESRDARALGFGAAVFDRVLSISAIEHVEPEQGGDALALREIRRVLKSNGLLTVTLPFKERARVIYQEGAFFEQPAMGRRFFAREYDQSVFEELVASTGFDVTELTYIVERPGLLAKDWLEWGPGCGTRRSRWILALLRSVERRFGRPLDSLLAKRYLRLCNEPRRRLVNLAAALTPATDRSHVGEHS